MLLKIWCFREVESSQLKEALKAKEDEENKENGKYFKLIRYQILLNNKLFALILKYLISCM